MRIKLLVIVTACLLVTAGAAQAAGLLNQGSSGDPVEAKEQRLVEAAAQRSLPVDISARTRRGPRGPRGLRGAKGPAGPVGATGTFGTVASAQSSPTFLCGWESGACSVGSAVALCPAGTKVVSGGYAGAGIRAFISAPVPGGWFVGATNESSLSTDFEAIAMCAS